MMSKFFKFLLTVGGLALVVLGVACLVTGNLDKIKALLPCCKKKPAEFADYADA